MLARSDRHTAELVACPLPFFGPSAVRCDVVHAEAAEKQQPLGVNRARDIRIARAMR